MVSTSRAANSTAPSRRAGSPDRRSNLLLMPRLLTPVSPPLPSSSDAPVQYQDPTTEEIYEPSNYNGKYEGWVTLRRALEASRNVPAVRLTEQIGPEKVAEMARRLGLAGPLPPYLSLPLGSAEASLIEMVSAYSAFPNQGVRMRPYSVTKVTDRDGKPPRGDPSQGGQRYSR